MGELLNYVKQQISINNHVNDKTQQNDIALIAKIANLELF